MRLSIPPNTVPPALSEVEDTISRLQREVEAVPHDDQRAALLHEVAVLEELGRDDHGAARDWLSAVNASSVFREPLEQLIGLIERRRSIQNLGKLLDRLGRVANTEPEAIRAQLARGDFLTDYRAEPDSARAAYEIVLNTDARQPLAWLSLQYLAGKTSDAKLQERALAARIELAEDVTYRNVLRLFLAAVQEKRGRHDAAIETLDETAAVESQAQLPALIALERIARQLHQPSLLASTLERQFAYLCRVLEGSAAQLDSVDIEATRVAAADSAIRAALCHQNTGAIAKAGALLEQAARVLPDNDALTYACLTLKELQLDFPAAAELASLLLRHGQREGTTRAALALRGANLELSRGDAARAMAALDETLRFDPQCIAARALQLNLLQQTDSPSTLGFAYESLAGQITEGAGRARHYVLASLSYAESSDPIEAAKAALSQATAAGMKPRTTARIGRLLATLRGNTRWYQETTERLLRSGTPDELPGALFELSRLALLRGSTTDYFNYLGQLAARGESAWLGLVLASYSPLRTQAEDPNADSKSVHALQQLAQLVGGTVGTTLIQLAAHREQQASRRDKAERLLSQLHEANPAEAIIAAQLAMCLKLGGNVQAAAKTLAQTAASTPDPELALPLLLESGVLHWRSGDRDAAVRCFEAANQISPAASASLAHWSLCCARPDAPDARRRALDSALGGSGDRDAYAIERFALEVGLKGQADAATSALEQADDVGLGEGTRVVHLARALWPASNQHSDAIRYLESLSPRGTEIAYATRFYETRNQAQPDVDQLLGYARDWAENGSLTAALELFASAVCYARPGDEIAARRLIAAHLDGEAEACVLASAATLQSLYEADSPSLIDSPFPQAQLANLELAAPGASPALRAKALLDAGDCLGEENVPLLRALAAYNELAAGRYEAAFSGFQDLIEHFPSDLFIWEGLRSAAASLAKREVEADACVQIGALCTDPARAAESYRHAASLYADELQDNTRGLLALERAVTLDVSDFDSFDTWFRHLRTAERHAELVELCGRRIQITNAPKELTRLYWERARAERALGNTDSALSDLENVTTLEPTHVGARALAGEIYIARELYAQAAQELTALAKLPQAPQAQRQLSGAAAVDLYESKLNDLDQALSVLEILQAAKLDTLAVKERLARTAAKAERWEDAARLLESLMQERDTHGGRTQAARLALAIYRDRLKAPRRAENATRCLLAHVPTDSEAIDLVLKDVFPREHAHVLLTEAKLALFDQFENEVAPDAVARVARIAEFLEDLPLRQAALGSLVALGVTTPEMLAELEILDARSERIPKLAVDSATAAGILHPGDSGPFSQILRLLGPELGEIFGPTLKSLNLGRQQRKKPPEAAELRAWVAAYGGALRLGDFELYVGGTLPRFEIASIPDAKTPIIAFGEGIEAPLPPPLRAKLAAHVLGLNNGTTLLLTRDPSEVAALLVAACQVCDYVPPSASYALTPDFERLLRKHLSRRTRKDLVDLVRAVTVSGADPLRWATAARASLDRVGLVATGDVSQVLLTADARTNADRELTPEQELRVTELVQFSLSLPFIKLREQLGMSGR